MSNHCHWGERNYQCEKFSIRHRSVLRGKRRPVTRREHFEPWFTEDGAIRGHFERYKNGTIKPNPEIYPASDLTWCTSCGRCGGPKFAPMYMHPFKPFYTKASVQIPAAFEELQYFTRNHDKRLYGRLFRNNYCWACYNISRACVKAIEKCEALINEIERIVNAERKNQNHDV